MTDGQVDDVTGYDISVVERRRDERELWEEVLAFPISLPASLKRLRLG